MVTSEGRIGNAGWKGATFLGTKSPSDIYPRGWIFAPFGDDLTFEDITVDGYNGIAMALYGNRVTVINPQIRHPQEAVSDPDAAIDANGAGIRFKGGTGFRCYGGNVKSGGDGALQFSTDADDLNDPVFNGIFDGAYIGTRCSSISGRLMLVGTKSTEIRHVGFLGVAGSSLGDGECVRIQNITRPAVGTPPIKPISQVLFRSVQVDQADANSAAVTIKNELSSPEAVISQIGFEEFEVTSPTNVAMSVFATQLDATNNPDGPIRDLWWCGGGVNKLDTKAPAINIVTLNGGLFEGLRLKGGTTEPAIHLGDPTVPGTVAEARNIAFIDVLVNGVPAGAIGMRFGNATNCGYVRGVIAEDSSTTPALAAFSVSAAATGCYVDGVDLTGISTSTRVMLDAGAACRVRDLLTVVGQHPMLNLSPLLAQTFGSNTAEAVSSALSLTPSGGGSLNTVSGAQAGDLLTLRKSTTSPTNVTAKDAAPMGNLALNGDFPLDSADDVLTMIRSGATWLELARSNNA